MAFYDVKIESTEGEIVFNKDTDTLGASINKVLFKMNTLKDDTLNRAKSVRCELVIEGQINMRTKEETMKLAKWSIIGSGDNLIYRKVTVVMYSDKDRTNVLRQYMIDQMFCIDYDETFLSEDDKDDVGKFVLHIAQKDGDHNIDVFAN